MADVIDLTLSDNSNDSDEHSDADDNDAGHDDASGSDHESELELNMDDAARAQLQTAIANCPVGRLREVVARLALTVPAVEAAFAQELLGVARGTVQVIPRYGLCVHCGEEYDAREEREQGECVFHPGTPSPLFCALWM